MCLELAAARVDVLDDLAIVDEGGRSLVGRLVPEVVTHRHQHHVGAVQLALLAPLEGGERVRVGMMVGGGEWTSGDEKGYNRKMM